MRKMLFASVLFLLFALPAIAQRVLTGKVTDSNGDPIPNASVMARGTRVGTVTGQDGTFSLNLPPNAKALEISIIGYETQVVTIGASNTYNVTLVESGDELGEVVVTAGGILVKRRELGVVATSITPTQITQGKASNFAASLSGRVPGLQVNAVNGGLNPNYRLVLRGQRSITGNNQALLVLDNLIVPNNLLGNLNPEDIEDIQVLNGAAAAAAYGSDASNGAIVITTKKGKKGRSAIKVSQTTTLEKVSYYPQLQNKFGSGTTPDAVKTYTPYENQQYGPRFDGSMVEIGKPLEDGSIQRIPYSPTNARKEFWETGIQNQTDIALESGDDKSTFYLAGQFFAQKSTVPKDRYERMSVRANGTRNIYDNFKVTYTANYISNRYDMTTVTGSMYNEILMTPAHIPLTKYQNWRTDPFANPNGYFNEYYDNPYWSIDNWRQDTKNEYFQGNVQLEYKPFKPLTLTYRVGVSSSNAQNKSKVGRFVFSDYTKSISGSSKTDVAGSVSDSRSGSRQLVTELISEYRKKLGSNFELYVLGAGYMRENQSKNVGVSANGLVIDDLYNVSNTMNNPGASESNSLSRQLAVRGEVRLGFKDYLFLHMTARNDWTSVLEKLNRSFFYPSVDVSFIATDAISALQNLSWLNTLKIRAAYAYVGNVNLGAYALNTTFSQAVGYPYGGAAGYSVGGGLVAAGLKPEITEGPEVGIDFEAWDRKIQGGVTYYKTNTYNQTMSVSISRASGYSSLLTNVGEVQNTGLETFLRFTPIQNKNGLSMTIGANYALNRNKVISLADEFDVFNLASGGGGLVVAEVGHPFPLLKTTKYRRDPQGRVIVDRVTGFPSYDGSYYIKGTTNPPHIMGVDFELLYKGFRLSTIFEYRTGNYILNAVSTEFDFSGAGIRTVWFNRERFVFPNSSYEDPTRPGEYIANTNIQTRSGGADFWTDATRNGGVGENYTHSAAFWKMRELVLSYDLPSKFLGSTIKKATISAQGRNLFIWVPKTNLYTDPEYSHFGSSSNAIGFTTLSQTPPARYFGGTISLTF